VRSAARVALLALVAAAVTAAGSMGAARADEAPAPAALDPIYESSPGFDPQNEIDVQVLAQLRRHHIEPAYRCSDAVFLRRVYVDLIGTLPTPEEVRRFLTSEDPNRRTALVDELLQRDEFVDTWTLKWGDLLRVKAEFPIKLWPNGVQAYHRWIHDAIREDMPMDRFARELLTSSGSNFRVPAVNFYRAVDDSSPAGRAAAVALTFMGTRFERWPAERRAGMAAFFSRIATKATAEWKEEIIMNDPAPAGPLHAVLPDGTPVEVPAGTDPRRVFADWLVAPGNPWFARSLANRAWSWMFGRGVVEEVDDLRPDNPPSNPGLLSWLERELVSSGYDMRHLLRTIVLSRTYQASPIPRSRDSAARALFAFYPLRRLDAEVLIDALCRLDGRGETYVSIVPEPYTYLPNMKQSIRLADGTITSPFLEMFGRPARDTGLESERSNSVTDAQRLYLLNSSEVEARIERSPWLRYLLNRNRRNPRRLVRAVYTALLARLPTSQEQAVALRALEKGARMQREGAVDLVWALINSKEFLYRH
jgi:hypothetical protein